MDFAQPWVLFLLPLVLAAALLRWLWVRHLIHAARSIGSGTPRLTRSVARARERLRAILIWAAIACALIAAARPRGPRAESTRRSTGANLCVLIDCSRSMLAEDLHPDRLRVARRKTMDLLAIAPTHRVALMPFAAISMPLCPLTGDHATIRSLLRDCSVELFAAERGNQGSAIGATVSEAVTMLAEHAERGQAILVFSDGKDYDSAAVEAAARDARYAGIPVYGIFVADPEARATVLIDGEERVMESSRETLTQLAEATGGAVVTATPGPQDVEAIAAAIEADIAMQPWEERALLTRREEYQYPLTLALVFALIAGFLPTRRREEPIT